MTAKGMTSVSVSYEVRRQLNTLRTHGGYRSVDELLQDLIRQHRMEHFVLAQRTLRMWTLTIWSSG
jgi:Arc/MetJ-type ribon-helix-helix transcriptional regulator